MASTNSLIPEYGLAFKNNTDSSFPLFDGEIRTADGTEEALPKDTVLGPHEEKSIAWTYRSPSPNVQSRGETFGYLRFWAKHSTPLPGSGTVFGVKVEEVREDRPESEVVDDPRPRVLKYVGSPTGNLKEWIDITPDVAPPGETFRVKGPSITVYYVHVKSVPPEERPFVVARVFIQVTITAVVFTEEEAKA